MNGLISCIKDHERGPITKMVTPILNQWSIGRGVARTHSLGWARVPLSSFFLKFSSFFLIFPQTFLILALRVGKSLGTPWLHHYLLAVSSSWSTWETCYSSVACLIQDMLNFRLQFLKLFQYFFFFFFKQIWTFELIATFLFQTNCWGYSNYFLREHAAQGLKPLHISKDFSTSKYGWFDCFFEWRKSVGPMFKEFFVKN